MISKNEGEKYKEKFELDYFIETSAKSGKNAQEIFIEAAKILYNDYTFYKKEKKNKVKDNKETNAKLTEKKEIEKKKKCC